MNDYILCLERHIAENTFKIKCRELDLLRRERDEKEFITLSENRKQRMNIENMIDKLNIRLLELELEDLKGELQKEKTLHSRNGET